MVADTDLPDEEIRQISDLSSIVFPLKVANVLYRILTNSTKVRSPPKNAAKDAEHVKLVTIGVSHYCEKARWGLDLLEDQDGSTKFYYTEEAHPSGFHIFSTVPNSKSGKSMTPMTIPTNSVRNTKPDEKCSISNYTTEPLHDSTAILKQYCPFLYPSEHINEIDDMEAELDRVVGPAVRLIAYYNYLLCPNKHDGTTKKSYETSLVAMACQNTTKIESIMFKNMFDKGLKEGILKAMDINATNVLPSETALRQIIKKYSSKLSDERLYLVGNQFTAADLTLAALLSPLLLPPELDEMSRPSEIPPGLEQLKEEFRETAVGRHVLKMYRIHRFSLLLSAKDSDAPDATFSNRKVRLKTVPRDRTITEAFMSNNLLITGAVTAAAVAFVACIRGSFGSSTSGPSAKP